MHNTEFMEFQALLATWIYGACIVVECVPTHSTFAWSVLVSMYCDLCSGLMVVQNVMCS